MTSYKLVEEFLKIIMNENDSKDGFKCLDNLKKWFEENPKRINEMFIAIKTMEVLVGGVGDVILDKLENLEDNKNEPIH